MPRPAPVMTATRSSRAPIGTRRYRGCHRASAVARPDELLQLAAGLAQQQPGHDQQLNLLGALEDVEDLDVTGPLLQQLALAVAERPGQRHAAQRDVGPGPPGLA